MWRQKDRCMRCNSRDELYMVSREESGSIFHQTDGHHYSLHWLILSFHSLYPGALTFSPILPPLYRITLISSGSHSHSLPSSPSSDSPSAMPVHWWREEWTCRFLLICLSFFSSLAGEKRERERETEMKTRKTERESVYGRNQQSFPASRV